MALARSLTVSETLRTILSKSIHTAALTCGNSITDLIIVLSAQEVVGITKTSLAKGERSSIYGVSLLASSNTCSSGPFRNIAMDLTPFAVYFWTLVPETGLTVVALVPLPRCWSSFQWLRSSSPSQIQVAVPYPVKSYIADYLKSAQHCGPRISSRRIRP